MENYKKNSMFNEENVKELLRNLENKRGCVISRRPLLRVVATSDGKLFSRVGVSTKKKPL